MKEKEIFNNIFESGDCLSMEQLRRYATKDRMERTQIFEIERHLVSCDLCSATVEALETEGVKNIDISGAVAEINRNVQAATAGVYQTALEPRPYLPQVLKIAAAFALLVIFSTIAGYFLQDNTGKNEYAENFVPSPALESMVGGAMKNQEGIEILLPENGFNATGKLVFQWEYNGAETVTLEILDNRGQQKLSRQINGLRFEISDVNTDFPPGLYYWKLISTGETALDKNLLHVGKFFVNKP